MQAAQQLISSLSGFAHVAFICADWLQRTFGSWMYVH